MKENIDIAIIGITGCFPHASGLTEFWELLSTGKDAITRFSKSDLARSSFISNDLLNNGNYIPARGILDDVFCFDAVYFRYSPYEAKSMDPQHRLFIQLAWRALEDAGYVNNLNEKKIGVFAGCSDNTYLSNYLMRNNEFTKTQEPYQTALGNSASFLASKVSYLFNLSGPSITINTACSTGLVCVVEASKSLLRKDCNMAIAGATSIYLPQESGYLYKKGSVFSPEAKCRAFDEQANGIVRSNGAGVIVMKRLTDAIRDRDHIDAVIKGFAINNDGSDKIGYTAPSIKAQASCISQALTSANIHPETINYVEAHGTGTSLGDPIEIQALDQAFKRYTHKTHYCRIGSVKSNIGHTDVTAGIAGLLKVLLSFKYGHIPPSLHYNKPNKNIDFSKTAFFVNTALTSWDRLEEKTPRRAGVNSLGMGGTNAHVILEEPFKTNNETNKIMHPLLISARSEEGLYEYAQQFLTYFLGKRNTLTHANLADIANTLFIGRKGYPYRHFVLCHDSDMAIDKFKSPFRAKSSLNGYTKSDNKIVFMFTGQGSQYINMGAELYNQEPIFKKIIDQCHDILWKGFSFDLKNVLFPDKKSTQKAAERINQTNITQVVVVSIEYALAQLLIYYDVKPSLVLGHSLGEYTAACIAGVFSLETLLTIIFKRAQLIWALPQGSMVAVNMPEKQLMKVLPNTLSIASINTADWCVISGETAQVKQFSGKFKKTYSNCLMKPVHVSHAFHSQMMHPITQAFQQLLDKVEYNTPNISFLSTVTGTIIEPKKLCTSSYWINHLKETVRFSNAIKEAQRIGYTTFIEVGPGNTLVNFLIANTEKKLIALQTLPIADEMTSKTNTTLITFYSTLGSLWKNGYDVHWNNYYVEEKRYRISIPTCPFDKKEYVILPDKPISVHQYIDSTDKQINFYTKAWQTKSYIYQQNGSPKNITSSKKTWVIFNDKLGFGKKIANHLNDTSQVVITIEMNTQFEKINALSYRINPADKAHYVELCEHLKNFKPDNILHLFNLTEENFVQVNDADEFRTIQQTGFQSVAYLADVFLSDDEFSDTQVLIASNHLKKVTNNDKVMVSKSTLLGVCQTIPIEYKYRSMHCVDIGNFNDSLDWTVHQIIREFNSVNVMSTIVAYRQKRRWHESIQPVQLCETRIEKFSLKKKGIYIITGGLGHLGLIFARYIAENALNAHIFLLGRRTFLERKGWDNCLACSPKSSEALKIKQIKGIERFDATVHYISVDVSKVEALRGVLSSIVQQYSSINGVIHAAGLTGQAALKPLSITDTKFIDQQYSGKVFGAFNLLNLLNWQSIDFCVLFSSLATQVTGMGYASYSAANHILDAIAKAHTDKKIWSIDWDAWQSTLLKNLDNTQSSFSIGLSDADGINAFEHWRKIENFSQTLVCQGDLLKKLKSVHSTIDQERKVKETQKSIDEHYNSDNIKRSSPIDLKTSIINLFKECLGVDKIDETEDFYKLGGHSLLMVRFLSMLEDQLSITLTPLEFNQHRSIASLVKYVEKTRNKNNLISPIVAINSSGEKAPLFLFHPVEGSISCYFELSKLLNMNRPIFGIQDPSSQEKNIAFNSFEQMVSFYIEWIQKTYPKGPYLLSGFSLGGNLAFEAALQLKKLGKEIKFVGLIDSWALFSDALKDRKQFNAQIENSFKQLRTQVKESMALNEFITQSWNRMKLLFNYKPAQFDGEVVLFKAKELLPEYKSIENPFNHWRQTVQHIKLKYIDATHNSILKYPAIRILAEKLKEALT